MRKVLTASLFAASAGLVAAAPGRDPVLSRSNPWQFQARMGWWPLSPRVERRVYFYPNGRVEFDDGEAGEWDCANDCVSWTTTAESDTRHYHANLHQNQFGLRPRMFCGVITRDRRQANSANLFRPVLGSFVARGSRRHAQPRARW
mmetsp:Transcript_6546/g.19902  ORF Transcript_6546/g.19902 Transcript_6546/m.19902 type:complete len:146 (-) Transcript_6546:40-477(-)